MGKKYTFKKTKFRIRRLKKYVMTIDKPKRIIYWTAIETGLDILMNLQPQNRLLCVHYDEEMRWIPEMCISAPVYAKLRQKGDWYPCELDKVKKIGLSLHDKTKLIFKLVRIKGEDIKIQPSCVYPSFFVDEYRVRILIGNENKVLNSIAGPDNYSKIQKIIAANDGMVLVNGDKFLSFWPVGSSRIYAYSPAQGDHIDLSFMLRSNDFKKLLDYLVKNLKLCGSYSTYTIKILHKEVIPTDIEEVMQKHDDLDASPGPFRDFPTIEPDWPKPKQKAITNADDEVVEEAPKTEEGPELRYFDIKFSKDFNNNLFPDRGFLYGGFYLRDPKRIIHINVAAAIFLHHFHGIYWENKTISDVFELGNRIYQEAEMDEKLTHPDWTKRFSLPIKFCNREYKIAFEKVVYGDITTQEQIVANIRLGVTAFFRQHDMGMIWGPHVQLIWQESNMYFTFSPKERDAYARKWTHMMSYDLPKVSERKKQGSAGISWYKRPELLADTYFSNIRLKHRKDGYKILKLRIFEAKPYYENWYNWKGFGPNKWSLIGEKNICEYIDSNVYPTQYPKIFSIATITAMFCIVRDTTEWEKSTIDDLMRLGIQFYNECIQRRSNLEVTWALDDMIKEYLFCKRTFILYYISENIKGFVFKARGPFPSLIQAFKLFFENYAYGVLVVRDITIPFFWDSGHFKFLFLYDRVFGKNMECLCNFENIYSRYRSHGFGMSFKTITDMYNELVILLNMEDNDKFMIHSIEPIERPPLLHYCPFGEFGAKLDAYDDLHEGDYLFDFRADKQTYCNLILGLCYAWFTRPLEWDQEDINDLLYLGDKMYCRIIADMTKCTEKNYVLKLSDCKPAIGINTFTFTESQDKGIFKYIPEATEEGEECDDEDVNLTEAEDDDGEGAMGYATVLTRDIYKMLEHWEQPRVETAYAILDSKLFQLAIWKKNSCFFIFDPKAARLDGKLTERRMARFNARLLEHADETDFKHYQNCGVAYVAYFYTWEAFLDYIIYLVPEENYTEPVTINTIEITGQPLTVSIADPKKADKVTFVQINVNSAVLRASMSQDEAIFTYRNQQEAAMCVAALAFARLTPAWKWNKQVMDVVLRYGDRLYQQSILAMDEKNPARLCSGVNLTVPEICPTFTIYKIKFQLKIDNIVKTALTPGCDNRELKKLYMQMQTIDNEKGVICVIKGYTNAIFRIGPMYFCFDPHKTDPEGYISNDGLANISRHTNMETYIKYFCTKSLCIPGPNTYECYSITIIRIVPPSLPEIFFDNYNLALTKPDHQDVYHDIGDDMRLMKVQFEKARIPQCFLALGAVLNSRLEYADVWGYHVFKKIEVLGEYIMRQLICHRTKCVPDQQPILEECNFSIRVDNRLVNFVVSRVIEAVIDPEFQSPNLNLRNGLYAFFKELSKACIIGTSDDKWYALWQDGPRFYMFWLRTEIKKGFVQSAKDWMQLYAIIVAEAKSYHQIYHVKQITTTIIELGDKPKLEVQPLCDCFFGDYSDARICPKCNYDLFAMQVQERIKYFNKCKKCFKRFAQGIDIMEPCNLVIKQSFYGTDNYFTFIEACCLVAAGMFTIKGIPLWSKLTIFNIFQSGADLLATSVAVSRKTNLHITEMEQQFVLCGVPLQIIALTPTKEKIEYDNLYTVLSYILRKHKIAYLMDECKLCVTLLNDGHAYYLFYPGQNSPDPWCTESSCFIRYDSVKRMVKNLLENSKLTATVVDIGPIICITKQPDPLNYQYCKLPCKKIKPCDQVRTKIVKCPERKPFILKFK